MSELDAIDSFTGKWRERWPEWGVAEVFVPAQQRGNALAWAALVQELTDAAWGGADPRPGEAKLGWWIEELQGWTKGARRHPLGAVLQKHPAPWSSLAGSLPSLRDSRERPLDATHAGQQVAAFAEAIAAVDAALFEAAGADDPAAATCQLLHLRLAHHAAGAAPLAAHAAAGDAGASAAWARQLAGLPVPRAAARPRRLWVALASTRLRRGDAGRPLAPARALWAAWTAARRG